MRLDDLIEALELQRGLHGGDTPVVARDNLGAVLPCSGARALAINREPTGILVEAVDLRPPPKRCDGCGNNEGAPHGPGCRKDGE